MNISKTFISALLGGIVIFLLGFVFYGMLLDSFMKENFNQCANRPMEEMVWWALIISNLIWAGSYSVIFSWAGITGFMNGLQKGALIAFLIGLSYGLSFYSMTTTYNSMTAMIVDLLVGTAMGAIGAGVVAWYLGRGTQNS